MRYYLMVLLFLGLSFLVTAQDNAWGSCEAFYAWRDSVEKVKVPYFEKEILAPALADPTVPRENKEFLQSLHELLQRTWLQNATIAAMDKPLLAVFELEPNETGIVTSPKFDCANNERGYTECNNVSHENTLLMQYPELRQTGPAPTGYLAKYPEIFVEQIGRQKVYLYSREESSTADVVGFAAYENECLEYYQYELNPVTMEHPLIASVQPLKILFQGNDEIDRQLKVRFVEECYDCRFVYEPELVFAHLEGVPDLFFTYVDKFSLKDQYDYPSRSLVMRMKNGQIATLWNETVDLFGCSCL